MTQRDYMELIHIELIHIEIMYYIHVDNTGIVNAYGWTSDYTKSPKYEITDPFKEFHTDNIINYSRLNDINAFFFLICLSAYLYDRVVLRYSLKSHTMRRHMVS
jgi:hypothetical protein